mgnify:CR=1 FL=1
MSRQSIFLAASFISSFGDFILVTSLPHGLGFESGNIQFAVIAWLFPAMAVFGASFFARSVARRHNSARTDYAKLLLAVAIIEILTAVAAIHYREPMQALVLSIIFVIGYAFIKEGIPRLLYQVTMYRFFVGDADYARLVGLKSALDIVAALSGMLFASQLVALGQWRYGLLIDATTFVIFALVLLFAGRDFHAPKPVAHGQTGATAAPARPTIDWGSLRWVLIGVPLFHAVNALFPNYFPLISTKLGFMNIGASIVLIAVVRLPGVLSGIFYSHVSAKVPPRFWVRALLISYCAVGFTFLAFPSAVTMSYVVLFAGLNIGIHLPSDIMLRNQLTGDDLVHFNTIVLRWLAVFQFAACCLAIWLYSGGQFRPGIIAACMAGFVLLSVLPWQLHKRKLLARS